MRNIIAAAALAACCSARAVIPVSVDLDLPRALEFIQTQAQWGTQNGYSAKELAEAVATTNQLRATYASMTGDRGLVGAFAAIASEQGLLPSTYTQMLNPSGGLYGSRLSATEAANAVLTEAVINGLPPSMREIVQRARRAVSMQSTMGSSRYEQATQREADLRRYFDRVGTCADIKCSSDLANVIGARGLGLQNEILKNQALDQAMRAERAKAEAQAQERYLQSIGSVRVRTVVEHEVQP